MDKPTLIQRTVHEDHRGAFFELFRGELPVPVVQMNVLQSIARSLRGVHVTLAPGAGKYVSVLQGAAIDYAVDLRPDSADYLRVHKFALHGGSGHALYVPPGFGHALYSLSQTVAVYGLTQEQGSAPEVKLHYSKFGIDVDPRTVILSDADQKSLSGPEWSEYHEVCVRVAAR